MRHDAGASAFPFFKHYAMPANGRLPAISREVRNADAPTKRWSFNFLGILIR